MAELLRHIDNRYHPDLDASKYFIVFCARKTDSPLAKPGHAFVIWGKEDADAGMSSQLAFGFYPKNDIDADAILGSDVPGQILNEATKPETSSLLTARIFVRVNKNIFDKSQSQITNWRTTDYNLFAKNCISFARSVANEIGLFGASSDVGQLPADYFSTFIANAQSSFGGTWRSNDTAQRFSLKINGPNIEWTESSTSGESLVKNVQATPSSSTVTVRVERQNTDDVLKFLGFSNAVLRADIIDRAPEPSFLLLHRTDLTLTAEWRGLLVKKLANGKLDNIVQPSQMPAKPFVFVRVQT